MALRLSRRAFLAASLPLLASPRAPWPQAPAAAGLRLLGRCGRPLQPDHLRPQGYGREGDRPRGRPLSRQHERRGGQHLPAHRGERHDPAGALHARRDSQPEHHPGPGKPARHALRPRPRHGRVPLRHAHLLPRAAPAGGRYAQVADRPPRGRSPLGRAQLRRQHAGAGAGRHLSHLHRPPLATGRRGPRRRLRTAATMPS